MNTGYNKAMSDLRKFLSDSKIIDEAKNAVKKLKESFPVNMKKTEKILNETVRDISSIAVAPIAKSAARKIISKAFDQIEKQTLEEVKEILIDEIATAHTTKAGKTSRLTSASMRVTALINSKQGK